MGNTKQRNRVNVGGEDRSREASRIRVNNTAADGQRGTVALHDEDHDALGQVAAGSLGKGLVQATLWTVAILFVMTVGPYLMPATKKPAAGDKAKTTQPVPNEVAIDPTKSATDVANSAPASDQQKAAKHMGLNDTKTADPNSNPLEKKSELDSLLDVN